MVNVFLIEGEHGMREMLWHTVPWTERGYELVGEAEDGETALTLIQKTRPDILITDIKMPFMDGLTLSRIVKKEFPSTKIMIISGCDDLEYVRQARSLGVDRYLLKPIRKNAFLEALDDVASRIEKEKEQTMPFAQRYTYDRKEIYSAPQKNIGLQEEAMNMHNIDVGALQQEKVDMFLCNARTDDAERFAKSYLKSVGTEALRSKMFQQYVLLNLYFFVVNYVTRLGCDKADMEDCLSMICGSQLKSEKDMQTVIAQILKKAILLREESSKGSSQSVIHAALYYMENNFSDSTMTLKKVACVANVSANHFSALFSQEMGKTFIEYLTQLRMNRAKELLRYSDKRSGEIALEVGYKDPHYFSFLFKKTQGCTPSEYRNRSKGFCA